MGDWVVETPSLEEDLMNNRVVMLNQNGVNRVVEIIKEKEKEIERLNNIIKEVREYITSQKLHKFQDTTGGLTYDERKLLEILDKENK